MTTPITPWPRKRLDTESLHRALDQQRRNRGTTWQHVAREVGIPASTFTRMGPGPGGGRPAADALVRMLAWLGTTDLAPYITTDPEGPTT